MPMNSDQKKSMVDSFKEAAAKSGKSRFFWEEIVDRIDRGEIHGIDLSHHYRNPKCVDDIAIDIQRHLSPDLKWAELHQDVKRVYFEVIRMVKQGLDY